MSTNLAYKSENIPVRSINLDNPPSERWIELMEEYKVPVKKCYQILDERITNMIGSYPKWIVNLLIKSIVKFYGSHNHYYEELVSISKILDLPLEKVIIAQYGYELFSACTSTIVSDPELYQYPIHLRTMDWDDNTLRPLTINLNIIKNNELMAVATTWVGFIGFMTIVKPNVCSISINYRRNDNMLLNYPANIYGMLSGRLTVSYMVREAVLNDNKSYSDIVTFLQKTPLISPCYVTMTGMTHNSGVILVRDRNDCQSYYIDPNEGYLIQTNIDPHDFRESRNDKLSIERKHIFKTKVYPEMIAYQTNHPVPYGVSIDKTYINPKKYTDLYLTQPILKYNVVYYSIMSPGGYYLDNNPNVTVYNYSQQIYPSKDLPILTKPSLRPFWNKYPVPEPPLYNTSGDKLLELDNNIEDEDDVIIMDPIGEMDDE